MAFIQRGFRSDVLPKATLESSKSVPHSQSQPQSQPLPQTETSTSNDSSLTGPRSQKQFAWVIAGASCIMLSAIITRRSVASRLKRVKPKMFDHNTNPYEHFSPFQDAVSALSVATVNVASVGLFVGAGMLWAVDISSLEEMRAVLRGRLGYAAFEHELNAPQETEEGLEELVAKKRNEMERSQDADR